MSDVKIVFIDDDRELLNVYTELLKLQGVSALGFYDGATAVAELSKIASPKVVLADFSIPGLNGEELLKKLVEVFSTRSEKPKIYSCSGLVRHPALSKNVESLISGFLPKPVDVADFVKMVSELLTETTD